MMKGWENNMKKKKPNCMICEWMIQNLLIGSNMRNRCGAQAAELTSKVYNKKMCRSLYRAVNRTSNIKQFDKANKRK